MAKPLSRPNELGRAIGYRVDVELIREKLKGIPIGRWEQLRDNQTFVEQVERAAGVSKANAASKAATRMWVVLKIEHGVPVMIDAYRDKRSAKRRQEFLRQHMRPEMDQVALFPINL